MKFSAAVLAFAATVAANYPAAGNGTVYTTEVVTAITTYCPAPTTLTHGDKTYTVTKPTTLTITDCPCTVSKPVYVTSSVVCHTCNVTTPTYKPAPPPPAGTGSVTPVQSYPPTVTAGAGKTVALSGAGLAAALGLAALL